MSEPLGVFFRLLFPIRLVGRGVHTCSACTGTRVCPRTRLAVPPCAHPRLTHSISFSGGRLRPCEETGQGRQGSRPDAQNITAKPTLDWLLPPIFQPI